MGTVKAKDKIVQAVDDLSDEMLQFLQKLVRIDTTVPPGRNYPECAELIGSRLKDFGYDVEYVSVPNDYMEKHTLATHTGEETGQTLPRINVMARMEGPVQHPVKHFSGHFDVVPAGEGWTVDPFGGEVRDGRLYGRGSTDQKSGIAASIYAVEAIQRAGFRLKGTVEQSATVDEESGGFGGVGYLVNQGYINKDKQDYVIITECLDVDGICIGHRGAVWFELKTIGKVGHGCMPHLAVNAVDKMASVIQNINQELRPKIESRFSEKPIMPEESKMSNLMPIWIDGFAKERPSATIPPACTTYFNRWFNPEENLDEVRKEITGYLEDLRNRDSELNIEYIERLTVESVLVPTDNTCVKAYQERIRDVVGRDSHFKLSPGFDDQRFVVVDGEIEKCYLYGPGVLNMAHLPDEYVPIEDLVNSTKIMALATADVLGVE
jgi:succinyl-diaminopimelate desuccinylase